MYASIHSNWSFSCYSSLKFNNGSSCIWVGITSIILLMDSCLSSSNFSSITFFTLFLVSYFIIAGVSRLKSALPLSNFNSMIFCALMLVSLLDFVFLLCKMFVDPGNHLFEIYFYVCVLLYIFFSLVPSG